jgi:hypothetical protein
MFTRLQDPFCELVMRLTWSAHDDELDLGISEHILEGGVDLDSLCCLWPESGLQLASWVLGFALEHGVEDEELWEGEDKGYVECQACEADP